SAPHPPGGRAVQGDPAVPQRQNRSSDRQRANSSEGRSGVRAAWVFPGGPTPSWALSGNLPTPLAEPREPGWGCFPFPHIFAFSLLSCKRNKGLASLIFVVVHLVHFRSLATKKLTN